MTTIRAIPTATPARTLTWTDGKLSGDKVYAAQAKALLEVALTPVGPVIPVDWSEPDSAAATMHAALTQATGACRVHRRPHAQARRSRVLRQDPATSRAALRSEVRFAFGRVGSACW